MCQMNGCFLYLLYKIYKLGGFSLCMVAEKSNNPPRTMISCPETSAVWKELASQRYPHAVPLDDRGHVYYAPDATDVLGAPIPVVVKYLPHTEASRREISFARSYSGWIAGEVYAVERLDEGLELIMEPASGSLSDQQFTSPHDQYALAYAIAELVSFLELDGLGHFDLKPANIFTFNDGTETRLRLGDFGLTHSFRNFRRQMCKRPYIVGTPGYQAPEFFAEQSSADYSPDIFAFGMVLYHLVQGRRPTIITTSSRDDYAKFMRTEQYREGIQDLPINTVHPTVLSLIYTCTEVRASYRPSSFRTILDFLDKNP